MRVSRELRVRFPDVDLELVDSALSKYEERHVAKIIVPKRKASGLLGWQTAIFLCSLLAKSRALHLGAIASWNMGNASSGFLNVRAHYEATAGLGHLLHCLRLFYDGKMERKALDAILFQKSLGVRDPRWKQSSFEVPDAINVLTQVKALDSVWAELFPGSGDLVFKRMYDGLCEFCHLNFGGLDLHRDLEDDAILFHQRPILRQDTFGSAVNAMDISLLGVFALFDATLALLKQKEELPPFYKAI